MPDLFWKQPPPSCFISYAWGKRPSPLRSLSQPASPQSDSVAWTKACKDTLTARKSSAPWR